MDARSPDLRHSPSIAGTELTAIGGLFALGTAFLLSPYHVDDGPVICPFLRITGLPCPACGLTRSWVHLTHGNVAESWAMNPFGVVLVAGLAILVVMVVRARVQGVAPPTLESLVRRPALLVVAAAWLVFGVARMT